MRWGVASRPRCRWYSARIGTNACENAPSPNIRRRMFGNRNAASKASIWTPAPKNAAFRLSRASPVMRERSVIPLTVDRARRRFTKGVDVGEETVPRRSQALVGTAKTGYYYRLTRNIQPKHLQT